ncbi:MAG: response regulator transcription factor [Bacteroidales bacterium]|nr:response regulator transcription factor [Bacteroidales bacterium]
MGSKVLLVDDEKDILEFLCYNLRKNNFVVLTATNGKDAIKIARAKIPELIILDIMMPEMDGIEACNELRAIPELKDTVMAFLTARTEDYTQIAGFDAGADDFIKKPIRPNVFISRVNALLRRRKHFASKEDVIELDNIIIDKDEYLVVKDGKKTQLPKKEFELLYFLSSRPNKVFSREEIFNHVWGDEVIVGERTIDVHIKKIREKIGFDNIRTYKGIGYSFILSSGI